MAFCGSSAGSSWAGFSSSLGDAVAGEYQAVAAVVQITQGEEAVVQHVLQRVPHLGGGDPHGGGQGGDGDGGPAADHGQIAAEGAHLLPPPQAAPQTAQTGAKPAQGKHDLLQIPGYVRQHPQISHNLINRNKSENGGEDDPNSGKALGLGGHLG